MIRHSEHQLDNVIQNGSVWYRIDAKTVTSQNNSFILGKVEIGSSFVPQADLGLSLI